MVKSRHKCTKLGIRGAKGAPLPRLCFAQLPLSFNYYLCYEKCYVHTNELMNKRTYEAASQLFVYSQQSSM